MKNIKKYIKRLYKVIRKNEMRILPGQIAYFIVLSIIPLVSLIGYIASLFSIDVDYVVDAINGSLPKQIIEIILPAFSNTSLLTGISFIIVFFIASNGTSSIIVASNILFKLEDKGYIRRRIKAFLMLLILVTLFLFMLIVLAFGDNLIEIAFKLIFTSSVPKAVYEMFLFAKWLVGLLIVFILVKMIFTIAPDSPIPSKNMNKGALFTTLAWLLITSIYSIYVTNFADYSLFYGSLANIVILMIWIYILSYTLVIGIAINSDDYLEDKKEIEVQ